MESTDLLELVYRAPFESEPWRELLESLRKMTGASHAQLLCDSAEFLETEVSVESPHLSAGSQSTFPPAMLDILRSLPVDSVRPGSLLSGCDLSDYLTHRSSIGLTGLSGGEPHRHMLILCAAQVGQTRLWLTISRNESEGDFSRKGRNLLMDLAPAIGSASTHYMANLRLRCERDFYADMIKGIHIAIAAISIEGKILNASSSAYRILCAHHCMRLEDNYLRIKSRREQQVFLQRLRKISNSSSGSTFITRATCNCNPEKSTVLLRPAPPGMGRNLSEKPAVIMHIKESFKESLTQLEEVASLFKLSPTEARTALLLSTGSDIHEIAISLGITKNSARTYCKRIFSKTGTRRQAELVGLILDGAAVLSH